MQPSLFLFQFRLSPREQCINLNFQQLDLLPNQVQAVCTRDILGVQTIVSPENFDAIHALVNNLVSSLIDAHSFYSFPNGASLQVTPINFFEVKDSGPKSTVFGYTDPSISYSPLIPDHSDNEPFRKAAKLVPYTINLPTLGLALSDFRNARTQIGPYYAFYAYRVLEDIANSFGRVATRKKGEDRPNFEEMNKAFGTTEEDWVEFTNAGIDSRHLQPTMEKLMALLSMREELIKTAKHIIDLFIKYKKL